MKISTGLKLLGLVAVGGAYLAATPVITGCTTDSKVDTVIVTPPVANHPFDSIPCLDKISTGNYALKTTIASSCTLPGDSTYSLQGLTFVNNGATLTIGAGAVVKGKYPGLSALIIDKGAKLVAVGTAVKPIVFTSGRLSAQRGDFGGVVLIGNGVVNVPGGTSEVEGLTGVPYGGSNNADSSGVLKYVRIEYAGYLLSPNNELNSLTFAAVGSKTQASYIEAYEAFDDCFEWFGGAVSPDHLVCMGVDDDMFDWDYGWVGTLQFALGVQNASTNGDANGIEADNNGNGENYLPRSNPKIANVTLIGNKATVGNGGQFGMRLRRGTAGQVYNALVTGWLQSNAGRAVRIDGNNSIRLALNDSLKGYGIYAYGNNSRTGFAPTAGLTDSVNTMASLATKVASWFTTDTTSAGISATGYSNFKPTTNLNGAVALPSGFATATYIGAFDPASSTLWTGDSTTNWFRKF
jgi:hypothetical protein